MKITAIILIIFISLFFYSCMTGRKAVTYMDNHYGDAAKYCNSRFPFDSTLRRGDTVEKIDTLMLYDYSGVKVIDTCNGKIITKTVPCPPSRIITMTKFVTDTFLVRDTRDINALQSENGKLNTDNQKLSDQKDQITKGRNSWRLYGLILSGFVIVAVGIWSAIKFKLI